MIKMITVYCLLNTELGQEENVLKKLKKEPYVKEAYHVHGVYEIVTKIEAESREKMKYITNSKILFDIPEVRGTLALEVTGNPWDFVVKEEKAVTS